ncbi:MAG: adenosylcobinamide-phosphate synthase CbiB [Oscillospiraceae bacterium]|nr:adenosylcobinamide-phosphate synthase CbiB [Oscillospiraceae bacterium]
MIIAQSVALSIGFLLDFIFGDPNFKLHPIRLMGKLIELSEKLMRKIFPKTQKGEFIGGIFMAALVLLVCGGVPFAVLFFAYRFNLFLGVAVEAVMCYFMLAAKSLRDASMEVYTPLICGDIERAREKVSMIVGRDTDGLDEVGITKAAVETVAENTGDGVIAPLIYMAIGGGVLGCLYKAVNTMDSMVGYKNEKYINFGKAAAKIDDIANFIPSRISARLMIISAYIMRLDGKNASMIYKRDSRNHASPNSAQTESVMAGALRIQLGGDAYYFGELYKKPFIGDDIRGTQYIDIKNANRLMYMTAIMAYVICIGIKIAVGVLI